MADNRGSGVVGENRADASFAAADAAVLDLAAFAVAATIRAGAETDPPLTATQVHVLVVLGAAADGATLTEVGNALGSSAPSATQLCRGLFDHGLLDRSEGSGATIHLRLNPSGRDALQRVNASCLAQLDALCDTLSEEKHARVMVAFRALDGVMPPLI